MATTEKTPQQKLNASERYIRDVNTKLSEITAALATFSSEVNALHTSLNVLGAKVDSLFEVKNAINEIERKLTRIYGKV